MLRPRKKTREASAESVGASGLPAGYSPRVAGYARGPWMDPQLVTPSELKWINVRTAVVRHSDGADYLCVRVFDRSHNFVGWWAINMIGTPLDGLDVPSK